MIFIHTSLQKFSYKSYRRLTESIRLKKMASVNWKRAYNVLQMRLSIC